MRKEALIVAAGLTLGGCGVAAPNGENYYFNGGEKNPEIVKHEECHQEKIEEISGVIFWGKYLTDNDFRCAEEKRCNFDNHPLCLK